MLPMKNYFKNQRTSFVLLLAGVSIVLSLTNCALLEPCGNSKEDYLDKFEVLIADAKDRAESKSSTWSDLDKRYSLLYESCYEQWEQELSLGEKSKVAGWIIKFQYYRHGKKIMDDILE